MRRSSVWLDLPRYIALNTPWWLARANLIVWIATMIPFLFGLRWFFVVFMAWVLFNFVWGYRAWRAAGSPALDEQPSLAFRSSALKSLWPPRDTK